MQDRALQGVRVLDLTQHVAGPYCTKLLADFGADVIKVERPQGDSARSLPPFAGDEPHQERSLLFAYLNTNKKSITLDLKTATGKSLLHRLLADTDIVVENFTPRVMPSLGLDYDSLSAINPSLVMVSISNFGQTGPYRDYKAADIVHYALGGLMYIFGSADREPLKHALRQTQFKAGTNAATAALIGWYHQQFTGEGQHIDISIQECVASALRDTTSLYTYVGSTRQRQPAYTGDMPRSPVPTKDGYIVPIHFGGAVDWDGVADFIDAPDLKDEAFATPEEPFQQRTGFAGCAGIRLGALAQVRPDARGAQASRTHLRRSSQPGGSACQRAVRRPQLLRRHRASRIWQYDIPGRALHNERNPLASFVTCAAAWRAQPGRFCATGLDCPSTTSTR